MGKQSEEKGAFCRLLVTCQKVKFTKLSVVKQTVF